MARSPDWFDRLDSILTTLRQSKIETLGRREVQSLFGCSERDSLRLLNRFGAAQTGGALAVDCSALRIQLEAVRDGETYRSFVRKQGAVASAVAVAKAGAQARFRRIPGTIEFQPRRGLAHLPAGITLEPGRLEVRFALEEDLWDLLDQFADIAAQDKEFRRRAEPAAPLPKSP